MQSGELKRSQLMLSVAAALSITILWTSSAAAEPRATPASCREAINGLTSLLDAGKDDSGLYRNTYAVVVNSCGPAAAAPRTTTPPSPPDRAKCHDLAAAMVDLIEDDKIDSAAFADARDRFAAACAPR